MKTFVILGMHRSATSLVAGGIKNIIHIGDNLMPPSTYNVYGHFENMKFVNLNNDILADAGGSWCDPPEEEKILALKDKYDGIIKNLIEEESRGHELWGWKDPRTTLTIKLFLPHLINPHFILCFREPYEVFVSLQNRDKFTRDFSRFLIKEYNNRLLRFITEWLNGQYIS